MFQRKLIAKIFVITFLTGISLGLMNHGIARFQEFLQPERYQIYVPRQYQSPGYGTRWPNGFIEFLGLSQPIYVKVETNKGNIVSETYYSIFGSMTISEYISGKLRRSFSGAFYAPLFMLNCLLPLMWGCLSMAFLLNIDVDKILIRNSCVLKRKNELLLISKHSSLMGIINFLIFYLIPSWINVFKQLM